MQEHVRKIPDEYAIVIEQHLVNAAARGMRFIDAEGRDLTPEIAPQAAAVARDFDAWSRGRATPRRAAS